VSTLDSHAAIEAVWRLEAPTLIAGLMRLVRDLGAAEDLAHDALVSASSSGRARACRGTPARG